jgi:peptidyl-prolyl cis-trans isomerase C
MKPFTVASVLFYAVLLALGATTADAFQSPRHLQKKHTMGSHEYNKFSNGAVASIGTATRYDRSISLSAGFLDDLQGFFKQFTTKASASHILIKGGAEAANKLEDLKAEIGDSPVSFAKAAAEYSACPSASRGGDLGSFGPGAMVKEFDTVVFKEPVGVVHGPIKTQFGYHLIYIRDRTE